MINVTAHREETKTATGPSAVRECASVLDHLQVWARTPGHQLEAPVEDVDAKASWGALSPEEQAKVAARRRRS